VVDQCLHRLVDAGARRRGDLLVLDAIVTRRHAIENLTNDLHRLTDLVQADRVAVECIAVRTDDDVELDLVVTQVRHVTTQVPRHTGRTQNRTRRTESDGFLCSDDPYSLKTLAPDRLFGHQRVVFGESFRQSIENVENIFAPARGQVGRKPTGADEVVIHPQSGDLLEKAEHFLALAPAVDHHRDRADVHAVRREEQQVAAHAVQFGEQHAHPHRSLGNVPVDTEQLLNC